MVWVAGFDPATSRSRSVRASRLRYTQILTYRGNVFGGAGGGCGFTTPGGRGFGISCSRLTPFWSGRAESNRRIPGPKPGGRPLSHTPVRMGDSETPTSRSPSGRSASELHPGDADRIPTCVPGFAAQCLGSRPRRHQSLVPASRRCRKTAKICYHGGESGIRTRDLPDAARMLSR